MVMLALLPLLFFPISKNHATTILFGVKVLNESPTWSGRDVALELCIFALVVKNGEMLTLKRNIVDQMIV